MNKITHEETIKSLKFDLEFSENLEKMRVNSYRQAKHKYMHERHIAALKYAIEFLESHKEE